MLAAGRWFTSRCTFELFPVFGFYERSCWELFHVDTVSSVRWMRTVTG